MMMISATTRYDSLPPPAKKKKYWMALLLLPRFWIGSSGYSIVSSPRMTKCSTVRTLLQGTVGDDATSAEAEISSPPEPKNKMVWIGESDFFGEEEYRELIDSVRGRGHRFINWRDDWWQEERNRIPHKKLLDDDTKNIVVFHGSLGNANRIRNEFPHWKPGVYCNADEFYCSQWYPKVRPWLLHDRWVQSTVQEFVNDPYGVAGHLVLSSAETTTTSDDDKEEDGATRKNLVFVRPDSPLKPFAGRVCSLDTVTLRTLDYGFYYDDIHIPIIIAPICNAIGNEYRFVVVNQEVVSWCGYVADHKGGRRRRRNEEDDDEAAEEDNDVPITVAREIATTMLKPPEDVYILDLCQVLVAKSKDSDDDDDDGDDDDDDEVGEDRNVDDDDECNRQQPANKVEIRLLELNPFSGADLYGCPPGPIIDAIAKLCRSPTM